MGVLSWIENLTHRGLLARGVLSRSADTSLARLHVYDAPGRGPLGTIVVVHGIGSSAIAYGMLIQKLRGKFRRVIAPDLPGHGKSGEPRVPLNPEALSECITELLDREITEPSIVFGGSLGGAVAVTYALTRPTRVRALILASPAGAAMEAEELAQLLKTFRMTSKADAADFLGRLSRRAPWYTPLIASELMQTFARPSIGAFTASVRPEHLFTPEQLAELKMPIYLLWGRADRLLPGSNLAFYRKHLPPHAIIEEPEAMGHCPHMDDPTALAAMIAAFARDVEQGARRGAREGSRPDEALNHRAAGAAVDPRGAQAGGGAQ